MAGIIFPGGGSRIYISPRQGAASGKKKAGGIQIKKEKSIKKQEEKKRKRERGMRKKISSTRENEYGKHAR